MAILGNFDVVSQTFNPTFQHTGTWHEYFSGQLLNVTDVNANVTLAPGEYRLYTDEEITPPEAVTNGEEVMANALEWLLSPNPSGGESSIFVFLKNNADVQWQVTDLQGKLMNHQKLGQLGAGAHTIRLPIFEAGMYLVQLRGRQRNRGEEAGCCAIGDFLVWGSWFLVLGLGFNFSCHFYKMTGGRKPKKLEVTK